MNPYLRNKKFAVLGERIETDTGTEGMIWMKTEQGNVGHSRQKTTSELKMRVQTGAVMTIVGILVLWLSSYPYVLNAVAALLSISGIYELLRAVKQYSRPRMLMLSLVAIVICIWGFPHYPLILTIVWTASMVVFFILMRCLGKVHFSSFASILPCTVMLPLFFRSFVEIRQWPYGLSILILVTLGCIVNDVAAYFVGRAIGSHKLAPIISPGKTVEGGLGGFILSTALLEIISSVFTICTGNQIRYGILLIYLMLASLIGQFGDLSMSMIKRSVGIKDFGNILPGHGGILDRFDSLLFVAPFAVIYYRITGGFLR